MMHFSTHSYQSLQTKKKQIKELKQHAKTNGSYFSAPLIDKSLSTKPLAFRHVFRSFVQGYPKIDQKEGESFLDYTQQQPTTIKLMNLMKIAQQKNSKNDIIKWFRRHYRIDIKEYLKRKYQKQTYQLPLQAFQLVRYVQKINSPWKTNYLQIYKPHYFNDNLKRKIQDSMNYSDKESKTKSMFKRSKLPRLFRQLLKCSIQFGGLDNFIMTTSNVYVQQDLESLQINYTSFTGLTLYKAKGKIGAHQYFEIAPYLTPRMLQKNQIGVQERIRFFLINCLCIITKKDFMLDSPQVQAQRTFDYEEVLKAIKSSQQQTSNQFSEALNNKRMQSQHVKALNIKKLLDEGLVQNNALTWQKIFISICPGKNQNQNKQQGQVISNVFTELHNTLFLQDEQKQFYQDRGLHSKYLYIPVKYRAELGIIFEKKAWWEIFNIKSEDGSINKKVYNFLHEAFCFRLLKAILDRYINGPKTKQQAIKFNQDQSIRIIFEYLKQAQFSPLMKQKRDGDQSVPQFSELYKEYLNLKQKLDDM